MYKGPVAKDPSQADFRISEAATPVHEEELLGDIFRDQTVLGTALEVLSLHRDVRITNTLLHVILELDFGNALYFVTKAIQREVQGAVRKMALVLQAYPRAGLLAALSPFLFRETSSDVIVIVEFFRITGTSYLQTVLQDLIVQVETYAKANQIMEGSSGMLGTTNQTDKAERIMALTTQLVSAILKTPADKLPATLRYVCKAVHSHLVLEIMEAGFAVPAVESSALLHLVVSHLLGVRFLSLGLTCPALFMLPDPRSEFSQDSLITLSNILLGLLGFGGPFMSASGKTLGYELESVASSSVHLHVSEMNSDCESFFTNMHKSKSLQLTYDAHRAHLWNWFAAVGDFVELENRPSGPLTFFALETYASVIGRWLCDNALDFLIACEDEPLIHADLYKFCAANSAIITQLDYERKFFKPQMVLGPGIWNPVQYGRAWKFEVKLPSVRTQDMFAWIPTGTSMNTPLADRSIIDWMIRSSKVHDFLVAIICTTSSSAKMTAATQKYIRSWRKISAEITAANGQLVVVCQAPLSASQAISKKLAPNFPIIFDHYEHIASFFRVAGYGNSLPTGDDITAVLVDSEGRVVQYWDNSPMPKVFLPTVFAWNDLRKSKNESQVRRKPFRRGALDELSEEST